MNTLNDSRFDDLLSFVRSIRRRYDALIKDIVSLPAAGSADAQMLILWRLVLLSLTADIADSIIALAERRHENHARAMRMLDRSLFEYGLRLEYYVFYPNEAHKHGANLTSWWGVLVNASRPYMNLDALSQEERDKLDKAIADAGEIEFPKIQAMLNRSLHMNGFRSAERKRRARWILNNYYQLGSALVHGSQGSFIDFLAQNPTTGEKAYTPKSVRYSVYDTLFNTALHLIGTMGSEEKHRQRDLAVDYWYRDFELVTGRWEYVASWLYGFR